MSLKQKDKATAILLAMDKKVSGKLLKYFTHLELKEVVSSAKLLPEISPEELEYIIDEFENQFIAGIGLTENAKNIKHIIEEGLGKNELDQLLNGSTDLQNHEESIWDNFKEVDHTAISNFLLKEHPQTTAYIISMIPPSIGANVLLEFPDKKRADIMNRTVNMKKISPYMQKLIEKCIKKILSQIESNKNTSGSEKVANLINELEKPQVETLLTSLESVSKEAFEKVRPKVFLFEDLITLSPNNLSILFNNISLETLSKAINGTSEEIKKIILDCLSIRQRRIVEENNFSKGSPIYPREIAFARRIIVQEAISLLKTNKIQIAPSIDVNKEEKSINPSPTIED
ncbi:Flagellar motor switch protein FliG [Candidatus Liberibacter americanus str. Sao Paulo]|uniref:Flagellar motor switch protein FliG n=2 Tax=Candidatus Liberibacter americanus TaxID=309868 RepID=U6B799_9HYPH|nr:flagellar motor switch protein FliG [Candidatus Liberibacter americanus]AHA27632.1 Flagellar motor switch protein FliG [Candidatus Liberibacter americanus str. Sao Paulo]